MSRNFLMKRGATSSLFTVHGILPDLVAVELYWL